MKASHLILYLIVAMAGSFVSLPATAQNLSATYTDPSQAKQLIQRALQLPQSQNDTKVFYSDGISHFDGFIPCNPSMKETPDTSKYYNKYTYYDGRVSSVEGFDETGKLTGCYAVWNNGAGAPVLSAYRNKDGAYDWYMYAEYDSAGKIEKIYRYNNSFELQFYNVFSYEGKTTSIKEFSRDSKLGSETIYEENGDLFIVEKGEKRLVSHVDRKQAICALKRFGLKPLYPNY